MRPSSRRAAGTSTSTCRPRRSRTAASSTTCSTGSPARRRSHADHVRDHRDGGRGRTCSAPLASPTRLVKFGFQDRDRRLRQRLGRVPIPQRPCRSASIKIDREFVRDLGANPKTTQARPRHRRARRRARARDRRRGCRGRAHAHGTAGAGRRLRPGLPHRPPAPAESGLGLARAADCTTWACSRCN